jgi:hypothetical protein
MNASRNQTESGKEKKKKRGDTKKMVPIKKWPNLWGKGLSVEPLLIIN